MDPLSTKKPSKTPQSFLGENSSLVNLDNLIKPVVPNNVAPYNPFSDTVVVPPKTNLFQQQQQQQAHTVYINKIYFPHFHILVHSKF